MKKLSLLPILLFISHLLFSQTFTEQTVISLTGVSSSSVAWGDYDNDGDLDILLTGYVSSTNYISKIYRNNGNNSFIEQTSISLPGISGGSVAWDDYDNDGDLDILLTGYTGPSEYICKIYRNNGNNTFSEQNGISLTGVEYSSVAWGDYDNDGDLDILLTGRDKYFHYISKIYQNNGNNTFTEQTGISLKGVYDSSVAWGDYDNDGDLDILLTGGTSSGYISKIYQNNGNNTFTEQTQISLIGIEESNATWGDYDNDGDLDILLTGNTGPYNNISRFYKNNGDNSFTEQIGISLTGVASGSVAWGDYDNDGDLDVLLTGYVSYNKYISKIYRNNGNNTFAEQTSITLTGVADGSVAWADYDNDGDLDILLTGISTSGNISKIYRNEASIMNTPPTEPSVSIPTVYKNNVSLSWGKGTDAQTPSDGLTYNLYIKKVSDGNLAMSPMSDVNSGFRRIVQLGNMQQVSTKTIQNFDYGEYEWYIQSIDQCFSGSIFSKGQNFKITTPSAPTNLIAIANSGSEFYLSWIDNSNYETGYVVERSIGNNQNFSPVATLNSNSINYSDKGLAPEILYFYRVKALYNNISSEYSNEIDVRTTFTEQTGISLTGVSSSSAAWGDYDNDGDLDILLTGKSGTKDISKIYRNNGDNTFSEQIGIKLNGFNVGSVAWGDYDNDGDLDILLTGKSGSIRISKIYRNNGNNTFTEQTGISLPGVYNSSAA